MDPFKARKISKNLSGVAFVVVMIELFFSSMMTLALDLTILGVGLCILFAAGYIAYRYWRCPKCKAHFTVQDEKKFSMNNCPYCDEKLR